MPIILCSERLRRCCQKATTNVHTIKEVAAEEDKLGRKGADNRVMVGGTCIREHREKNTTQWDSECPGSRTATKHMFQISSDVMAQWTRRVLKPIEQCEAVRGGKNPVKELECHVSRIRRTEASCRNRFPSRSPCSKKTQSRTPLADRNGLHVEGVGDATVHPSGRNTDRRLENTRNCQRRRLRHGIRKR